MRIITVKVHCTVVQHLLLLLFGWLIFLPERSLFESRDFSPSSPPPPSGLFFERWEGGRKGEEEEEGLQIAFTLEGRRRRRILAPNVEGYSLSSSSSSSSSCFVVGGGRGGGFPLWPQLSRHRHRQLCLASKFQRLFHFQELLTSVRIGGKGLCTLSLSLSRCSCRLSELREGKEGRANKYLSM